jgi:hypothetical protein
MGPSFMCLKCDEVFKVVARLSHFISLQQTLTIQTGYILENSHHDVCSYDPKGQTGLGKPKTHKMLCQ